MKRRSRATGFAVFFLAVFLLNGPAVLSAMTRYTPDLLAADIGEFFAGLQ